MSFDTPWLLLALVALVPALVAYLVAERRRRRAAAAFAAPAVARSVVPRPASWRRHLPPLLYVLALAVLIVALARPHKSVAEPVERASVVLAIDRSGSMQSTDIKPSRLQAARVAADRLVDITRPGVRIGVVAFNQRPLLILAPTTDKAAARGALSGVSPAGSTATGDALALALAAVRKSVSQASGVTGDKVPAAIVLLTDGASVRGRDAVGVAAQARRRGVTVHTVSLGTPSGTIRAEVPGHPGQMRTEPVPPDPASLAAIARAGGGKALQARDARALSDVFSNLGSLVSHHKVRREVTAWVAGIALLLALVGAGLSLAFFGRLP